MFIHACLCLCKSFSSCKSVNWESYKKKISKLIINSLLLYFAKPCALYTAPQIIILINLNHYYLFGIYLWLLVHICFSGNISLTSVWKCFTVIKLLSYWYSSRAMLHVKGRRFDNFSKYGIFQLRYTCWMRIQCRLCQMKMLETGN